MENHAQIAVVGAGHAGIEAALACARMGLDTVLFTLSIDTLANMPCNPSIGGTGKGHLVCEIDALGGEMGFAADHVTLQSRTLNLGKGAAVHSKRIQADRRRYHSFMRSVLESQENLRLIQEEVVAVGVEVRDGDAFLHTLTTALGEVWHVDAAILATGTYLRGKIHVGDHAHEGGPDGLLPANGLSASVASLGIRMMRFKTGTPPRIHAESIDFDRLERQDGDAVFSPFSALTDREAFKTLPQCPCFIVYTNEKTHEIIRKNLHRSAMYGGHIEGTGPRYCPSIEDKIVRFADKERHQLFAEPMGDGSHEIYLQGLSTSMPPDVQYEMVHSLVGFEHARIMRYAYAIEYDCIDPTELLPTLEFKKIRNLYGAGQFNGTSGYEEAAAQGLIAGINAALRLKGEPPLILSRDSSYIGTLIDDLVTKGTNEPYRIMTSRSEYRLLLRQDNADARLTPLGRRVGLVSDRQWEIFNRRHEEIALETERIANVNVPANELSAKILEEAGTTPLSAPMRMSELIKRPQVGYDMLAPLDPDRPELPHDVTEAVEIGIKYEGYVKKQLAEVARHAKLEEKRIPDGIRYEEIKGLRIEAMQKLAKIRPVSIGQAARISGVSPADISVLLIALAQK